MNNLERTKYFRELRQGIVEAFDEGELKLLVFDLSIDWGELQGDTKSLKTHSLIMMLARHGRLSDLLYLLREQRPHLDWPMIPSADKQIEDALIIAPGNIYQTALQDYLDKMSLVLADENLSKGSLPPEVKAKLQAYTDSVLPRLDKERRLHVVSFLFQKKLLGDEVMISLHHLDLSGMNLRGIDLHGVDLQGANFSSAYLDEANFAGANLTSANFCDCSLNGADLSFATLTSAELQGASLIEALCDQADFTWAHLDNAKMIMAKMRGCKLIASLYRADFSLADLENAEVRKISINLSNFSQANLAKANLQETSWEGVDFKGAILSGADLSDSNLTGADLEGVKLQGAILKNTRIRESQLSIIDLASVDLTEINVIKELDGGIIPTPGSPSRPPRN